MTENDQQQLGATLWKIADDLRGAMNAGDFRNYILSLLFLRYLSDSYKDKSRLLSSAILSREVPRGTLSLAKRPLSGVAR